MNIQMCIEGKDFLKYVLEWCTEAENETSLWILMNLSLQSGKKVQLTAPVQEDFAISQDFSQFVIWRSENVVPFHARIVTKVKQRVLCDR